MDVAAWLRGGGKERYELAFREDAVDADVLRNLTADDLNELRRLRQEGGNSGFLYAVESIDAALSD